ncbi:MAG TPA: glycosyl hydrolase family 18 protein [Thermoanaerobaculia bacterium]|jgi:hypothetical protein|nr:glycosyl hydrolase family 18 protein [Thermoanaerobaculia bacterium]
MPGRNIIWCQTSDASQVSAIAGQDYSHVILSALHMHNDGGTYSLYLNDTALPDVGQDYWDAVASLQAAGVTVTALLGGAGNGTWQCVTDDLQQAANVLVAAMDSPYNLQGFDLDWETSPAYSATTIGNLTNAIVAGNSAAIVTHAPVPGLLSTYDQAFWNLVGDNLAWINVQWYGDSTLRDDYANFVSGQTSGAAVSPNKVVCGATVMPQGGVGYTPLCTLMKWIVDLQSKYSDFGGVAGWEFTQTIGSTDPKVANWNTCIQAALGGSTTCVACS